jgi:hypothetical protein
MPIGEVKALSRVQIKAADRGEVTAVFATFNEIDADRDWTMPGAFKVGQPVPIGDWEHTSWGERGGRPPVGLGTIGADNREAWLSGRYFMETQAGRDAFVVVKNMHAAGLGEWSYGYEPTRFHFREENGQPIRVLEQVEVFEVSSALRGVGVDTRTVDVKSLAGVRWPPAGQLPADRGVPEFKSAIRPHSTPTTNSAWDGPAAEAAIPADASVSDLRSVFAWVDPDADPETKAAYRFIHHASVRGPANLRACATGIGVLNGGRGGTTIPTADRRGVWAHLAGHMRDGDMEPPELQTAAQGGDLKTAMSILLADLDGLAARVREELGGGTEGKAGTAGLLAWTVEAATGLRDAIGTPADREAREQFKALRAQYERLHGRS